VTQRTDPPEALHVLFVDDEAANLLVWRAAVESRYFVLTASSGAEALALLETHEVAVVLADQRMPRMTGVELLEIVERRWPDTIRMLITAYADLGAAVDAINRGKVRRYLKKPWEPAELHAAIDEALEVYRLALRIQRLERRLTETERSYALGVVVSHLTHELRRPLANLKQSVQSMQPLSRLARGSLPRRAETSLARSRLDQIETTVDTTLHAIDQLCKTVDTLEMPTRQRDEHSVEPSDVLRVALRMLYRELRGAAELVLDVREVPRVRGTTSQIGQVLLSLLLGAVKAVADSGRASNRITVSLGHEPPWVRLDVIDTGRPIAEAELPNLFDPLLRSGAPRGAGLSLAISQAIARELGGWVEAANQTEGGVRMRLVLPALDRGPAHAP
jgi:signal transduction histidine kinase